MADGEAILDDIAANSTGEINQAAAALRAAITGVSPEARYTSEALGRLAWDGLDPVPWLQTIDDGLLKACEVPALPPGGIEEFSALGPTVTDWGATAISTMWDVCSQPMVAARDRLVYRRCPVGMAVLDLSNGAITWLDDAPTGFEPDDDLSKMAGDRLVWIATTEEEASGLDVPGFTDALHILTLDGTHHQVELARRTDRYSDRVVELAVARSDRIMVVQNAAYGSDTSEALTFDGEGEPIGAVETANFAFGGQSQITHNGVLLLTAEGSLLVNATDGALRPAPSELRRAELQQCEDRNMVGDASDFNRLQSVPVVERDGELVFGASLLSSEAETLIRPEVVVASYSGDDALIGSDLSGTRRWNIPLEVAVSARTFGGWPVVVNHSDEFIVVDPLTGTEATTVSDQLLRSLRAGTDDSIGQGNDLKDSWYEADADIFALITANDYWTVPGSELCPS